MNLRKVHRIFKPSAKISTCLLLLIILCLLFWSGCSGAKQPEPEETLKSQIPVDVGTAAEMSVPITLDVTGTFDSNTYVELAPQVGGKVKEVYVRLGNRVKKGQLLLLLDDTDIRLQIGLDQANLQQTLAKLGLKSIDEKIQSVDDIPNVKKSKALMENALQNYNRNLKMRQEDLISDKDVEDAKTNYDTSKADYQAAIEQVNEIKASVDAGVANLDIDLKKLEYTQLKSPMNGYVNERKVDPGGYLNANQAAFHLLEIDPIYLNLYIPEQFVSRLALGKEIVVTTDAAKNRVFHGKIINISPTVAVDTRTVKVVASVDNPEVILKPGMFGRISLITGIDDNAILVPRSAIIDQLGKTTLYKVGKDADQQNAKEVEVTKGQIFGDWIVIQGNVKGRDLIIVSNLTMLANNIPVKISSTDTSKPVIKTGRGQ